MSRQLCDSCDQGTGPCERWAFDGDHFLPCPGPPKVTYGTSGMVRHKHEDDGGDS